ncbi:MAG: PilZ domain-containing protein [Xanthobacteraceae bacterium]
MKPILSFYVAPRLRRRVLITLRFVMVETRRAPRYRVSKIATIGLGRTASQCRIHDLSTTGAALVVENPVAIPERFILAIPEDGLQLPCHVVWRKEYRVGVQFEDP